MPQTDRLDIPYPAASESPDGPAQMQGIAEALDNAAIDLPSGLLAARPAAGLRGQWYWATDTEQLFRDTGTAWKQINMLLGTSAGTAAAGNDPRLSDEREPIGGSVGIFSMGPLDRVRAILDGAGIHTANGAEQKVPFDATKYDVNSGIAQFDNANDRVIARVNGSYHVIGVVAYVSNAVGVRNLSIRKNGAAVDAADGNLWLPMSVPGVAVNYLQVSGYIDLVAGDYLEMWSLQNSGGNLAYVGDGHTSLTMAFHSGLNL